MLLSVGHGRLDRTQLAELLHSAGVESLVDVRRFPGSRRNPDLSSDAMTQWLADAGIGYRLERRLGGRRRLPAGTTPEDSWWRVEQFAAYAAHTRKVGLEVIAEFEYNNNHYYEMACLTQR